MAWRRTAAGDTRDATGERTGGPEKQYPGGVSGPRRIATKEANPWGLYDMIGNGALTGTGVPAGAVTDPQVVKQASYRVIRGGSWNGSARSCRSADRSGSTPEYRDNILGFRPVLIPERAVGLRRTDCGLRNAECGMRNGDFGLRIR